jgi:hypothetical protein
VKQRCIWILVGAEKSIWFTEGAYYADDDKPTDKTPCLFRGERNKAEKVALVNCMIVDILTKSQRNPDVSGLLVR